MSDEVGARARSRFQSMGFSPQWVPTSPAQIGQWAREQKNIFSSGLVSQGIEQGKSVYEQKMGIPSSDMEPFFPPFTEDQTAEWAEHYVLTNGYPKDPKSALAMSRAFIVANADQIGLPPEFIVASSLVSDFPDTPEDALRWSENLGSAFLETFGIPIVDVYDTSSFISASARVAVAQLAPGIPFTFFEATFAALSDGQLTSGEAKGIIIGAAGYIGAVIGQAFGIPAPIGAFLSQLVVGALVSELSDAFGWGPTDSEKLTAAQNAAESAADAARAKCTDLAVALWLQYQHYWDSIVKDLDGTIRQNQEWLYKGASCTPQSGIRLFGDTTLDTVFDSSGNPIVTNAADVKKGKAPVYRRYPYPITRTCADSNGCAYLGYNIGSIVKRDAYSLSPADLNRVPKVSVTGPGCDATTALAFWNARRYATPQQVYYAMKGKPLQWVDPPSTNTSQLTSYGGPRWEELMHSDFDYLQNVGYVGTINFGTDVGTCQATTWAAYMFRSLEQAAAAAALVQRDIARTVSAETTAYGIQYHLDQQAGMRFQAASDAKKRQAIRGVAARTAAFRHAVLEARRRGRQKSDLLNYGMLTAGGAALLGYTLGRR